MEAKWGALFDRMIPTSPGPSFVTALFCCQLVALSESSILAVARGMVPFPRVFPLRGLTAQW